MTERDVDAMLAHDSAAESGSVSPPLSANATYATDPDAFTDAWYRRRAAAYADDARKIVASLREYEDVHPADAPCLMPLLDSLPNAYWHDFPADAAGETGSANA